MQNSWKDSDEFMIFEIRAIVTLIRKDFFFILRKKILFAPDSKLLR